MSASTPFYLNELAIICALGRGQAQVREALFAADMPRGVAANDNVLPGRSLHLGAVREQLPALEDLPLQLRSRNNALLRAIIDDIRPAVIAARERYGAGRVAVVIGTSTSGVGETEVALREHAIHGKLPPEFHYAQQELVSPARFLAHELGLSGPAWGVSTACSSGARALMSAAHMLQMGLVDAVLCGGADSLCRFTVAGFAALESISAERCNPMSAQRNGINIGEGAALFLMTREPGPVRLAGWGESSDAHHISAPDPAGHGARAAMQQALTRAGLTPAGVDYIHMHGTATPLNDAMESVAIAGMFGCEIATSSTKPLTGHTLGAAGAIGAALCWLSLAPDNTAGRLPPHWWDGQRDAALPDLHLVQPGEKLGHRPRAALANAFAFGGNNASLVLCAE